MNIVKEFLWHLCDTQPCFKSLSKVWIPNDYFFESKSVLRKSYKIVEHHSSLVLFLLKMNLHTCVIEPILSCLLQDFTLFMISSHIPPSSISFFLPGPSFPLLPFIEEETLRPYDTLIANLVRAFL